MSDNQKAFRLLIISFVIALLFGLFPWIVQFISLGSSETSGSFGSISPIYAPHNYYLGLIIHALQIEIPRFSNELPRTNVLIVQFAVSWFIWFGLLLFLYVVYEKLIKRVIGRKSKQLG